MIDTIYFFILFLLVGIPLVIASYHDVKTRRVPIKTWWISSFIALPFAFILYILQFMSGETNIIDISQMFAITYTILIIIILYVIATYTEKYIPKLQMGGADFIGITIILITGLPISIIFSIVYMKIFIIVSVISIICCVLYNIYKKKKVFDYIIPLILPVTISYFIIMIGYFIIGIEIFNI